jgi:hypothetical protein
VEKDELGLAFMHEKWKEPISIFFQNEVLKYVKYKWRFLRRNEAYKKEYEALMKLKTICQIVQTCDNYETIKEWNDQYFIDWHIFNSKWNVSAPIDPALRTFEIISQMVMLFLTESEKKEIEILTGGNITDTERLDILEEHLLGPVTKAMSALIKFLFPNHLSLLPVRVNKDHEIHNPEWRLRTDADFFKSIDPPPNPDLGKDGILKLSIDLNYSKKVLLKELDDIIDLWNPESGFTKPHGDQWGALRKICKCTEVQLDSLITEWGLKKEQVKTYNHQARNNFEPLFDGCGFVKHCRDDAGFLPEPEWYALITILCREQGGVDLIHKLSQPHPGYSRQETEGKILHALNDSGSITCNSIKSLNLTHCKQCKSRVNSPLSLVNRYHKPKIVPAPEKPKESANSSLSFPQHILKGSAGSGGYCER